MIYEVEQPTFFDLFGLGRPHTEDKLLDGITLLGSGKGALALVLRHLQKRGIIRSKLDEILVPDWLGYWVYNQIQSYAFPAKRLSDRTRAILVYHQYGFPQDMDKIMAAAREKNLIVIEDCAHAFGIKPNATTNLLRKLMIAGQMIQSHFLHLFFSQIFLSSKAEAEVIPTHQPSKKIKSCLPLTLIVFFNTSP